MLSKCCLSQLNRDTLQSKKVLMRVDFNVPMRDGNITDDTRVRSVLDSIRFLIDRGAAVVLTSHLGRPGGKEISELSLAPVAKHLATLLGHDVPFLDACRGERVKAAVANLREGQILMLENLRFCLDEEANVLEFAKDLSLGCDLFVQDAFGTVHREHASTFGVTKFLPSYAGLLVEKELAVLQQLFSADVSPVLAIVAGAKVSSKLGILQHLLSHVDTLIIGGAMAYTFLKAKGFSVGNSLVEDSLLSEAERVIAECKTQGVSLYLPLDHIVSTSPSDEINVQVTDSEEIPDGFCGLDIGPKTLACYEDLCASVNLILWNGPLGVFEVPTFSKGTAGVARAVAASSAYTVVGGGDSVAAVCQLGLQSSIDHISTGGGAFLEALEGRTLPGVVGLMDQ
ncbi:MAG: phosphoglycerate kinase [bacterium]